MATFLLPSMQSCFRKTSSRRTLYAECIFRSSELDCILEQGAPLGKLCIIGLQLKYCNRLH